jgi:3-hydroxyisobutyrate dehydrogenase
MAENLVRAGFPLVVFDLRSESCAALAGLGASVAGSPAEVARYADIVHVNVLNAVQAECVLLDEREGVFSQAEAGELVVVHSTVGPESCRRLERAAAPRDIRLVDAPTTGGGSDAAARGDLTLIVGGEEADLALLDPAFRAMAADVLRAGRFGNGQVAKLVNNLMAVVNSVVLEEALRLAGACGVDPEDALVIANAGTGGSFVAAHRRDLARMADEATDGRDGQVAMSLKDLLAVLDLGRAVRERLPVTAVAAQYTDILFPPEAVSDRRPND